MALNFGLGWLLKPILQASGVVDYAWATQPKIQDAMGTYNAGRNAAGLPSLNPSSIVAKITGGLLGLKIVYDTQKSGKLTPANMNVRAPFAFGAIVDPEPGAPLTLAGHAPTSGYSSWGVGSFGSSGMPPPAYGAPTGGGWW